MIPFDPPPFEESSMPSPFPGMDPYLEGSEWTSVHTELAVEIARQLTPRLTPRYIARPEKRFVLATPAPDEDVAVAASSLYPDTSVAKTHPAAGHTSAGPAVMEAPLRM